MARKPRARRCFDFARIMSPYVNEPECACGWAMQEAEAGRKAKERDRTYKARRRGTVTIPEALDSLEHRGAIGRRRRRRRRRDATKAEPTGCGLYTRRTRNEGTDTEGLVRRDYLTACCPRVRQDREKSTGEKSRAKVPASRTRHDAHFTLTDSTLSLVSRHTVNEIPLVTLG